VWDRARGSRALPSSAAGATVAAHRSFTGIELRFTVFKSEGMVREEGGRIRFWGFPTGAAAEEGGGHRRPWVAASELVGSYPRARKARSEARER
jgi:hypothetical protein